MKILHFPLSKAAWVKARWTDFPLSYLSPDLVESLREHRIFGPQTTLDVMLNGLNNTWFRLRFQQKPASALHRIDLKWRPGANLKEHSMYRWKKNHRPACPHFGRYGNSVCQESCREATFEGGVNDHSNKAQEMGCQEMDREEAKLALLAKLVDKLNPAMQTVACGEKKQQGEITKKSKRGRPRKDRSQSETASDLMGGDTGVC